MKNNELFRSMWQHNIGSTNSHLKGVFEQLKKIQFHRIMSEMIYLTGVWIFFFCNFFKYE